MTMGAGANAFRKAWADLHGGAPAPVAKGVTEAGKALLRERQDVGKGRGRRAAQDPAAEAGTALREAAVARLDLARLRKEYRDTSVRIVKKVPGSAQASELLGEP